MEGPGIDILYSMMVPFVIKKRKKKTQTKKPENLQVKEIHYTRIPSGRTGGRTSQLWQRGRDKETETK